MVYALIKIFSSLPIFSCTDDMNFGEVTKEFKNLRFSLFRISFGLNKFYFFTYMKNTGFNAFYKLDLYKVQNEPTQQEIESKGSTYEALIENMSEDKIKLHIEALKHKINQSDGMESRTFNKIMYYSAIYLVLLPFLILWLKSNDIDLFQMFIFSALFYTLINIYLFLYQFVKVSSFYRFPFKEFKNANNALKQLARFLYQEWYASRKKILYITYVKNVEKYIRYSMFCIGLFVFLLFAANIKSLIMEKAYLPYSIVKDVNKHKEGTIIFDLALEERDLFNEKNLYKLNSLKNELLNGQVKQIIILSNKK